LPRHGKDEPTDDKAEATPIARAVGRWFADRLWAFTAAITTVLVATTLLSLLARRFWLADLCANLRVQQVLGVMLVALVACCFLRWRWVAVQAILLAIHLPWLLPSMQPNARFDSRSPDVTVMLANVWTANQNHQAIVDQIRQADPDVFAVLELGTKLSHELQQTFGSMYSDRLVIPSDAGNFGISLFSRYPLSTVQRFQLDDSPLESIAATVRKDEQSYRIFVTHPLPPIGAQRFSRRNSHLHQLASRVADYRQRHRDIPVIIIGDLNVTPWSPIFADFAATAGVRRAVHGNGLTPTWYALPNFTCGLALDHGLICERLDCVSQVVSEHFGSDHRAVTLALTRRDEP
jgi:endonuclease/exonuclease/phosphatase (EEP) superfamily protein YafD